MSHPYAQLHSPTTPTTNEVFPFLSDGQTFGASSSMAPSTSTSPAAVRAPRPRLTEPAKRILLDFFENVSEYPTADQKGELLLQVAAICPHYTMNSLNAWFNTHRQQKKERAKRDPAEAYEREMRKMLWPSLTDADCTKIRGWMVVNAAPKDSMLEQWSRALGKSVKHINEYVQHRQNTPATAPPPPPPSHHRRVSHPPAHPQPPPLSRASSSQRDELEDEEDAMSVDEHGPPRRIPKQSHLPTPGFSTSPEPIPHGAGTRAAAPRSAPLNLPPIATLSPDTSDSSIKTEPLYSPPAARTSHSRPPATPMSPLPTAMQPARPALPSGQAAPPMSPVRLASSIRHVDHVPPPRSLREFTERYARHAESADAFMRNAESGRYARLGLDLALVQQARERESICVKDASNSHQR